MNSVYTDQYPYQYGWSLYGQEQTENAQDIANYLSNKGVERNSIYAILGNMTTESFLNPGQFGYQAGTNLTSNSYGLGQWDPGTKYSFWLASEGIPVIQDNLENGHYQLDYLLDTPGQWSTYYVDMNTGYSSYYNLTVPIYPTMQDFLTDTQASLADKTCAWMVYWERPQPGSEQARIDHATHWASTITPLMLIWLIAKAAQKWRLK